ncbi:MAG: ethanolamine ammonia-lyase [Desulfuromusa sp.]|nr:ethanolamine ammonia-lyase [Desulfuromusa sp.]
MKTITPILEIDVPEPQSDEIYSKQILGKQIRFKGLKKLLGAADISKAGDRNTDLAPKNDMIRETARMILSSLTLQYIYDHPLTDDNNLVDTVVRIGYDVDHTVFNSISFMTLGDLKDHLLRSDGQEIKRIGRGMIPVIAAALSKLMDAHELIFIPRKIFTPTKARTLIGVPGSLSFRIQPNHPKDNLDAISLMVYTNLALGMGDCLIGVNPAEGSIDTIISVITHIDKLRRETGVPTQICVLGHVKTQLAALKLGAPVEILFQSFAGTERTLTEEFDVTVSYMDQAYNTMIEKGPLRNVARQFMYLETGQGSEMTYRKHNGIDMTTCEALCYGLCRRYDPFMVNSATGFIGPETHLNDFELMISNLQDNFMGKLLGLPMGVSPSYTLHADTHIEGQQMTTHLATAAGANFFMDVYLGTDRMLAHFVNSGHDDQTLREVHNRIPAPEFLEWAKEKGIFEQSADGCVTRGSEWGNPRLFCKSAAEFQRLRESLPSAPGFDNAGPRPVNKVQRTLLLNQSIGREAVHSRLREDELEGIDFRVLTTMAQCREDHLRRSELGTMLTAESMESLGPENKDIQIVITDGLSAEAIHHNIHDLLTVLEDGLRSQNYSMGQHILVHYGRVKLTEHIGDALHCQLIIMLIGERPGGDALSSRSMSAYLVYRLNDAEVRRQAIEYSGNKGIHYEYTLISNIYMGGLPALEAGSVVAEKAVQIITHKAAGNRLEEMIMQKK